MAPHSSTLAWKGGAWWAAVHGVTKSQTQLSDFTFTFHFHALEKEMATHSSVLAWRIPGTGKPSGLLSMGLHRVRHDWSDLAAAAAARQAQHLELYRLKTLDSVAKTWKQSKCPSTDEWIKKMWHVCMCVCVYIYTHTHTHTYIYMGPRGMCVCGSNGKNLPAMQETWV